MKEIVHTYVVGKVRAPWTIFPETKKHKSYFQEAGRKLISPTDPGRLFRFKRRNKSTWHVLGRNSIAFLMPVIGIFITIRNY